MIVNEISLQVKTHINVIKMVEKQMADPISACVDLLVDALSKGRKLLLMGNGGSAADAQHFAAEMVGRFLTERKALPAIALTTDISILTAVSNDYGYEEVFKRQVEALAHPGDILIGISTSGNSKNVARALEAGREIGATTVGLLGCDGGTIGKIVDLALVVPSSETPRIQEAQLFVIHTLCDLVETTLFKLKSE